MLLTLCPTKMESKLALALWLFPYISRTGGIPEAENMLVAERIHRNLEEQLNNFLRFTLKMPALMLFHQIYIYQSLGNWNNA